MEDIARIKVEDPQKAPKIQTKSRWKWDTKNLWKNIPKSIQCGPKIHSKSTPQCIKKWICFLMHFRSKNDPKTKQKWAHFGKGGGSNEPAFRSRSPCCDHPGAQGDAWAPQRRPETHPKPMRNPKKMLPKRKTQKMKTPTHRHTQTHTDTHRHTHRHTQTQTQTQT